MTLEETIASEEYEVCQKVIEKVAEAGETDPVEISPPLYEVINPDALERLFTSERALGKVVFNYVGCEVSVFSDGRVSVN